MGTTTFSGPVRSGTLKTGETNGPNLGLAVLEQETSITQNSTTAVSSTLYIPVGSKIINILVDVLTAFNSGTSAVLSVGITAGGTEYASGVDVKTATGRITPTFTAAQLAAMSNVTVLGVAAPTTAPVVVTVTPTGATSAGYVRVTLVYAQQP
jgi:metal-dependent HD superfamily phosphatase/phosphodiesterase